MYLSSKSLSSAQKLEILNVGIKISVDKCAHKVYEFKLINEIIFDDWVTL